MSIDFLFALKKKIMRIAQVAPLFEAVPPKLYGGTERVVHYLTEELVEMGHDVTLFASGDSVTKAELFPIGIDYEKFNSMANDPKVIEKKEEIRTSFKDQKMIFSLVAMFFRTNHLNSIK